LRGMDDRVVSGYLVQLLGEEGITMIEHMPEGEVTDEEIAEATGVVLNIIRRNLFIMNENKLAVCRRERDANSGWLTYLWHLNLENIDTNLSKEKKRLIKNLNTYLDLEEDNMFYVCPDGCIRILFDDAAKCGFMCPECGEDLIFEDNIQVVEALKKRLKELEKN